MFFAAIMRLISSKLWAVGLLAYAEILLCEREMWKRADALSAEQTVSESTL